MFKKLFDKIDAFILKHHKCGKNAKVFSLEIHRDSYGRITSIHTEYECSICRKKLEWHEID